MCKWKETLGESWTADGPQRRNPLQASVSALNSLHSRGAGPHPGHDSWMSFRCLSFLFHFSLTPRTGIEPKTLWSDVFLYSCTIVLTTRPRRPTWNGGKLSPYEVELCSSWTRSSMSSSLLLRPWLSELYFCFCLRWTIVS